MFKLFTKVKEAVVTAFNVVVDFVSTFLFGEEPTIDFDGFDCGVFGSFVNTVFTYTPVSYSANWFGSFALFNYAEETTNKEVHYFILPGSGTAASKYSFVKQAKEDKLIAKEFALEGEAKNLLIVLRTIGFSFADLKGQDFTKPLYSIFCDLIAEEKYPSHPYWRISSHAAMLQFITETGLFAPSDVHGKALRLLSFSGKYMLKETCQLIATDPVTAAKAVSHLALSADWTASFADSPNGYMGVQEEVVFGRTSKRNVIFNVAVLVEIFKGE